MCYRAVTKLVPKWSFTWRQNVEPWQEKSQDLGKEITNIRTKFQNKGTIFSTFMTGRKNCESFGEMYLNASRRKDAKRPWPGLFFSAIQQMPMMVGLTYTLATYFSEKIDSNRSSFVKIKRVIPQWQLRIFVSWVDNDFWDGSVGIIRHPKSTFILESTCS